MARQNRNFIDVSANYVYLQVTTKSHSPYKSQIFVHHSREIMPDCIAKMTGKKCTNQRSNKINHQKLPMFMSITAKLHAVSHRRVKVPSRQLKTCGLQSAYGKVTKWKKNFRLLQERTPRQDCFISTVSQQKGALHTDAKEHFDSLTNEFGLTSRLSSKSPVPYVNSFTNDRGWHVSFVEMLTIRSWSSPAPRCCDG